MKYDRYVNPKRTPAKPNTSSSGRTGTSKHGPIIGRNTIPDPESVTGKVTANQKNCMQNAKTSAKNKATSQKTSSGTQTIRNASENKRNGKKTKTPVRSYISRRTEEISSMKKKICSATAKKADAKSKINWKRVGLVVGVTAAVVGFGVATGGVGFAVVAALGIEGTLGAELDIDFNHTDDGTHEFPHTHLWDWSKMPPRQ